MAWAISTLVFLMIAPELRAQDQKANSCGCYGDGSGRCFCSKQAKCGCPGECEPKGCEEKRQKAMEKEIEAETKRVQEDYKKRSAAAKPPARESEDEDRPTRSDPKAATAKPAPAKVAPAKAEPSPPPPRRSKPMTAAQKKQLGQLLEAYLTECPDCGVRSVDAVRQEMQGR